MCNSRVRPSSGRRKLRSQLDTVADDAALLSHTVEEALSFDRHLDAQAGYGECPSRFPDQLWPRCELAPMGAQLMMRGGGGRSSVERDVRPSSCVAAYGRLEQKVVGVARYMSLGRTLGRRT